MPSLLTATAIHIRWMIGRDLPEVLDIEEQCYQWDAWTEASLRTVLRNRNCIGMVAEHNEKVVGFMIYELRKSCLHLLNFAVHPDHQRQGVGRVLMQKLMSKLSVHARNRIVLTVEDSNLKAQLFYKTMGFKARRIIKEYYGPGRTGYRMVFRIPS